MTAARRDLEGLPGWPRGLSAEQAAAYVGLSAGTFRAEVARGGWPRPHRFGKRLLWDKAALDRRFDEISDLIDRRAADDELLAGVQKWAKSA